MEIPRGNSREDIKARETIIKAFYHEWKSRHQEHEIFNVSLQEPILIRHISIIETTRHAAKQYASTMAVLMLEEVLVNAKKEAIGPIKKGVSNQKMFEKMMVLSHRIPGIGIVKLTAGIRKQTHEMIQYCITVEE